MKRKAIGRKKKAMFNHFVFQMPCHRAPRAKSSDVIANSYGWRDIDCIRVGPQGNSFGIFSHLTNNRCVVLGFGVLLSLGVEVKVIKISV